MDKNLSIDGYIIENGYVCVFEYGFKNKIRKLEKVTQNYEL